MSTANDSRPLRADAARNRETLLRAARAVFAEQGVEAPLEEVARQANVGIATLYRRFATREALLAAAFEPKMVAYVAAAGAAVGDPNPWEGFCGYVRTVCAMQAADAGFADVVTLTFPFTAKLDRQLRSATAGMNEVVDRAKAAGQLRDDFVMQDLVVLLMANAGVVNATKHYAHDAWERFAAYMLDAFRARGASSLPEPTSSRRLYRAMRRNPGRVPSSRTSRRAVHGRSPRVEKA